MDEKIVEYIRLLIKLNQDQFEIAKIILWLLCGEDEDARAFLRLAIRIAETYRPKLIGL